METNTPESPGPALRRLRMPLALLLALLVALGGYYFFHVERKSSYLIGRHFRLLTTMGNGIRQAVLENGKFLDRQQGEGKYRRFATRECAAEDLVGGKHGPPRIRPSPASEGYRLVLSQRPEAAARATPAGARARTAPGTTTGSATPAEAESPPLCLDFPLTELLDPLFKSAPDFDAVLLARGTGEVLHQYGAADLGVTRLDLLSGSEGWKLPFLPSGDGKTRPAPLAAYGRLLDVELGGRDYKLFVQPMRLPFLDEESRHGEEVFLIAGLVSADKFVYKSLAISSSLLALVMAALLLTGLSWPLLKLRLLGESQRVTVLDVLLVGVCSLLGVSVVTLGVVDLHAYQRLKDVSGEQLETFAQRLAGNIEIETARGFAQLAALEKLAAHGKIPVQTGPDGKPVAGRGDLLRFAQGAVDAYPFLENFTLTDADGEQRLKWTLNRRTWLSPPVPIEDRAYFQKAKAGNRWIESIPVSWSDGRRRAALAKPVEEIGLRKRYAVATLAIPMLSAIEPVIPPGFAFAVIDEAGSVQFHSDVLRNQVENFFVESDRDQRLRSAVLARHLERMSIRYGGEDYEAVVAPVHGLPPGLSWSVVALGEKALLRSVNLDWIVTTLIFLVLAIVPFALLVAAIALARPGYRAPWAWPDRARAAEYIELCILYTLFALAFVLGLRLLDSALQLIALAGCLPFLALLATYLRLRRGARGTRVAAVQGAVLALLLVLAACLFDGVAGSGRGAPAGVLALAAAACCWAALSPWSRRREGSKGGAGGFLPVSRAYPLAGVMLLALATVLPTMATFEAARRAGFPSLVKHGQLKLALKLEDRERRARRDYTDAKGWGKGALYARRLALPPAPDAAAPDIAVRDAAAPPAAARDAAAPAAAPNTAARRQGSVLAGLDYYGDLFFATRVASTAAGECPCRPGDEESHALPAALEALLPRYSDHSAEMRELLHDRASDCGWDWHAEDGGLRMHFRGERGGRLLRSSFARPAPGVAAAGILGVEPLALAAGLGLGVLLPFLLYGLVLFIARQLFLFDLIEPLRLDCGGSPVRGRNVFLVARDTGGTAGAAANGCRALDLKDLGAGEAGLPEPFRQALEADCDVLLRGFEHRISDARANERKLELLEGLVAQPERSVVVLSRVSPRRLFFRERWDAGGAGPIASAAGEERWRLLLASFTVIEEDLRPRADDPAPQDRRRSWRHLTALRGLLGRRPLAPMAPMAAMAPLAPAVPAAPPSGEAGEKPAEAAPPAAGVTPHTWSSLALRRECGRDPYLLQIGEDLDRDAQGLSHEQLLEELCERAEGHYRALWASCSRDEKVALGHLAQQGLVNGKSRRVVRRLMARGLVRQDPSLRLMNETFRRFACSTPCRDQVKALEKNAGPSAWDRVQWPFAAVLVGVLVFFMATQQELMDSTVSLLTGMTAGLPALVKLVDFLGGRRSAGVRM